MSFTDLFKNSVVEGFTNADISLSKILVTLGITVVLALYIFAIYRLATKSVFYSKGFAISMAAISVITAAILIAMQSNLVISLGMVGALSIVRFRTAIKEPMDIAFLFWAIAVGIVLAAGLIPLAVFGSIFIGVVLFAFSKKKTVDSPYILVVHCESGEIEEQARLFVKSQVRRLNLKSKSVDNGNIELNYEVRLKEDSSAFVNELEAMPGVSRVVLVSYNGDYMG